jgi:hypothetical protein
LNRDGDDRLGAGQRIGSDENFYGIHLSNTLCNVNNLFCVDFYVKKKAGSTTI